MPGEFPNHYILVGRTPIAVDLLTWAKAMAVENRWKNDVDQWRVARDQINARCTVSTVFLGLDHRYGDGDPLLFETLHIGGPLDGTMRRYCTYAEAERGHMEEVAAAKSACAKIDALAKIAGTHV